MILFKYLNPNRIREENVSMDLAPYFEIIIYTLMTATFIVLVLVFLDMFYAKEEKQE